MIVQKLSDGTYRVKQKDADNKDKQVLEKELLNLDKEIRQALSQKKDITSIHNRRMIVLRELSKIR